jgi:hypothetical protein
MNISLHLVHESKDGKPLTAAKTCNRSLIKKTAEQAIREAF